LILILVVALFIIGPGKLPETGAALGKAIRQFRDATAGLDEKLAETTAVATPVAPSPIAAAPMAPVAPPSPIETDQTPQA
jgi:TatA/E family protein of Tat protein translocase